MSKAKEFEKSNFFKKNRNVVSDLIDTMLRYVIEIKRLKIKMQENKCLCDNDKVKLIAFEEGLQRIRHKLLSTSDTNPSMDEHNPCGRI